MNYVATNTANAASYVAQAESNIELVATGLDAGAKHFYNNEGRYIGTRFTDGSAITPTHGGGCVEFLSTFAQEG
ncbi:hypothetical protein [Stenotrophomonas phage RAS14]